MESWRKGRLSDHLWKKFVAEVPLQCYKYFLPVTEGSHAFLHCLLTFSGNQFDEFPDAQKNICNHRRMWTTLLYGESEISLACFFWD